MRSFILKIAVFILTLSGFTLLTFWQADGRTDPFYLRFTTPEKKSLIIGTSRAAQGIIPSVLDSNLNSSGTFNYAMTVANSPYGSAYFKSILKKVNHYTTDGIFILEVSPWSISSLCSNPNDSTSFRENNLTISKISNVNQKPNIQYLLKSYSKPFYQLWYPKPNGMLLHNDGWLEVSISMDSIKVKNRTNKKIVRYTSLVDSYNYSDVRFKYFKKTIDSLMKLGTVYIVRMPVCDEMLEIENDLMKSFNAKIEKVANTRNITYFNLTGTNSEYQFTDGNHLGQNSAKKFSIELASLISQKENS